MRRSSSFLALACVFFVVVAVVASSSPVAADEESDAKQRGLANLAELRAAARERSLVSVGSDGFRKFVNSGPRPYRLMVYVTSSNGCQMCDELETELRLIAATYEKARYSDEQRAAIAAGTLEEDDAVPAHDTFFVRLDASRNDIFKELEMTTVPHIIHVAPTRALRAKKWGRVLSDRLSLHGLKAEDVLPVVAGRIGLRPNFQRPPEELNIFDLLVKIIALGSTIWFALSDVGRPLVDKYVFNRTTWFALSLVGYAFCISGGSYNRIRKVPFSGYNPQTGEGSFIDPSASSQYAGEGYLIGALNLLIGGAFLLLSTRVHTARLSFVARNLLAGSCLFAFHIFYHQLRTIYTFKNGGYNMGILWGSGMNMWLD